MPRLGPFDAHDELARGGMGVVYRGVHRASALPVAIKVIEPRLARTARFYEDFQREVRAAAQLAHPNVVTLLDYGIVSEEAERESQGALRAESPYLVMELADSGSLASEPPDDWRSMKPHLEALLEALAHAHARGLIHRDLKPSNVLLHAGGDEEPRVVLADFGLAHASDRHHEGSPTIEEIVGTPQYMAPEQVECRWRDFGPWTDLYAFGLICYRLVYGRLAFDGDSAIQMLFMQMIEPLPERPPIMSVPAGIDQWIKKLCEKKETARFQRAADALRALRALGDARPLEVATSAQARVVDRWESLERPTPSLLGAGLGLYFLRPVPLVDRKDERDALWSALRVCEAEGRARAISLRGASGVGKSRLAGWLAERADETGGASSLKALHEPSFGPSHGVGPMIAQHYRATGLSGRELRARLDHRLAREGLDDPYEREAVAVLIDGARETADGEKRISIRFSSPVERHVVVEGALARAANDRAVIVWLDDVHWGPDSLAMVQHALDTLSARVLFVLTSRDDLLFDRARELLEAIEKHPRGARVDVGPLADADAATLIEQLLGLRGELAHDVRTRTAGNPLFAVQLVGDWVERGILALTPQGFGLRAGERADLPDDLHGVWRARLYPILAARSQQEREMLELAAILGLGVDRGELDAALAVYTKSKEASFSPSLLEALARANLVDPTDVGFAFVHGMLRESLVREAEEAERAPAMHHACAAMLMGRSGRGIAARRARHYARAGELEASLEPFMIAAKESVAQSEYHEARAALAGREEVLTKLELPAGDNRWGLGWVLRAETHRMAWDLDSAERWAENALGVAEQHGWSLVRAEALYVLSHVARQRGDLARSEDRNRRALDLFDRLRHDEGRARTLLAMAIALRQGGSFDRAEDLYRRAREVSELIGDDRGAGNALLGLAHVARHDRDYAGAEEKYERARELFDAAGYRSGVAHCLMGRADVLRYRGELASAEAGYREALHIQESIGVRATFIAQMNIGLVLLAQDRPVDARALFAAVLAELEARGPAAYLGLVHTFLLPCAVAARDLSAFDRHLEARARVVKAPVDEDVAATAERAGRMLLELGDRVRAKRALELAETQWREVGDEARASAIAALVER